MCITKGKHCQKFHRVSNEKEVGFLWSHYEEVRSDCFEKVETGKWQTSNSVADNVKTWTGLSLEEVLRATEDRTAW